MGGTDAYLPPNHVLGYNSSIYICNTLIGMESGSILLILFIHIKYKIMVSLTIVFIGMVTQGGQDFTTLAVL